MTPFVSVVIPCRNEAVLLRRCLESVLASNYPSDRMEVLVADGMSEDGSRAAIASFGARVRRLDNPGRVTPLALNLAITAARGSLILRVDAHSVLAPRYVSEVVAFLEAHPDAWGAGGRMRTEPETQGWFATPITLVLSHRFGVGNSGFRTNGVLSAVQQVDTVFNCCWRREVFTRVGLFHEQLVRSQDIEMSSRIAAAGGSLWQVPTAETTYFARVKFLDYLRHNWSNGIWSVLPAAYIGRLPVSWRHLVPLAFVLTLLLSAATRLVAIPVMSYVVVNLAVSLHIAWRHHDPKLVLLLPLAFAGLHLAYGAGSLWGVVKLAAHLTRTQIPRPIPELSKP